MTDPNYRDRFGNDMAGLLGLIAENESFGIKWYRFPRAKQISEDWPHFFKQEQKKRVESYLMRRIDRANAYSDLPPIDNYDIGNLGLF